MKKSKVLIQPGILLQAFISLSFIVFFLHSSFVYAQKVDSAKLAKEHYYQTVIGLNAQTASIANQMIDSYKGQIKEVWRNKTLTNAQKEAKVDQLILAQTKALKKYLTTNQLAKMVPVTEIEKRDTIPW